MQVEEEEEGVEVKLCRLQLCFYDKLNNVSIGSNIVGFWVLKTLYRIINIKYYIKILLFYSFINNITYFSN